MFRSTCLFAVFLLFLAVPVCGQLGGNSTYAFLNLTHSARVASLGGKVVSIPDDAALAGEMDQATIITTSQTDASVKGEVTVSTEALAVAAPEENTEGSSSGASTSANTPSDTIEELVIETPEDVKLEDAPPQDIIETPETMYIGPSEASDESLTTQPVDDIIEEEATNNNGTWIMWTLLPVFLFITLVPSAHRYRKKKR